MSAGEYKHLIPILTMDVRFEHDVVGARQRARQLAEHLGFDGQDQTRIATAVSEIVRNAYRYAGGGRVSFSVETSPHATLHVEVTDRGPGIPHLQEVLDGFYRSTTGLGMGIIGARRLMDDFSISTHPGGGTSVHLSKRIPAAGRELSSAVLAGIAAELVRSSPDNPLGELQRQNQELLRTLEELRARKEELAVLNRELEDTNRGVVALYAELDERASYLRRVSDLKSSFLSSMSHEFRTPLNSILSLTRLLLNGTDGPLTVEQRRQTEYIRQSAEELSSLVNDFLDIAKVESGKLQVRCSQFLVSSLFGTLRSLLRPLTGQGGPELVFEEPDGEVYLESDEGKISQILRNLVSNALKFTLEGEVRVSAHITGDSGMVQFVVADTGLGIDPADQERIFEEFVQVENSRQREVKGTGLGLPLSRKLAELLGGTLRVESVVDQGSRFILEVPAVYGGRGARSMGTGVDSGATAGVLPECGSILIIDDDEISRYVLRSRLFPLQCVFMEAETGSAGLALLRESRPAAVFLDPGLPDMNGIEVLRAIRKDPSTKQIPVVIYTSMSISPEIQEAISSLDALFLRKESEAEAPLTTLSQLLFRSGQMQEKSGGY